MVDKSGQVIEAIGDTEEKKIVTVGFYDYKPYFYIDSKGHVTGIYHDIIQLLAKDVGFEVQYVMDGFSDIIESSRNNKVDLIVGLHYTEDRNQSIYYSDIPIGTEDVAIFVNQDIDYGDLEKLSGMKLALVKDEQNSYWISSVLKNKGIEVEEVYVSSYSEANQIFILGQVDATVASVYTDTFEKGHPIYRYSSGSVYIGGSKKNRDLIQLINLQLQRYAAMNNNPIDEVYKKYLPGEGSLKFQTGIVIGIISCIIFIPVYLYFPSLKRLYMRWRLRNEILDECYLPYYQPIVNPYDNQIVGVEALIRKKHPKKGILGPYAFIQSIEDNGMLDELTLWLLGKVIQDYQVMKNYPGFKSNSFYVSLNLSSYEVENIEIVKRMSQILTESDLPKDSICLEIIERFGISDMGKIRQGVARLKDNGFKIAIDDFGVDYSNLKLLEILDFDILKLDKYFVDEMEKSRIVKHTIAFLGQLTQKFGKSIVMEGVEDFDQRDMIRSYQYKQMYIQGYCYAKPMPLAELANLDLNSEKNS